MLPFTPNPEREGKWVPANRDPIMVLSPDQMSFTNHPIAKPVQSVPVGLRLACPLKKFSGDGAPADVQHEVIAETPKTDDIWAVADPNSLREDFRNDQGTSPKPDSVLAPFPLAIGATKKVGESIRRTVVVGSEEWLRDQIAFAPGPLMIAGGALVQPLQNPGNADLIVNICHWLAGNADRIAVGPRSGDVPRLSKLKDDGTLTFARIFMVGLWPGLALLVGGIAWFFRRR